MHRILLVLACVAGLLSQELAQPLRARAETADWSRVALIIARSLSYERTLSDTAGSTVGVLVLYDTKQIGSQAEAEALIQGFRALAGLTVHNVPFTATARANEPGVLVRAAQEGYDVVVVCAGLESQANAIAQAARQAKLRTVGLSAELVRLATALAVYSDGAKLIVAVNQRNAQAEGLKLNSQLLRVAKLQ